MAVLFIDIGNIGRETFCEEKIISSFGRVKIGDCEIFSWIKLEWRVGCMDFWR